ncbi:MAG TPA: FecR domain-containing protein [Polyangiaceae bacterium]|jgi:ferric-dicitrate binding protein FerR (iron transport regulator)|nr:FecR domain-containing protein [Polyangiaceae bacterium]
MNTPRYAAAAAQLLRRCLPGATVVSGEEARGIATIERALRARTRRRRLLAIGASLVAAAAIGLVATQVGKWRQSAASAGAIAINVTPAGRGAALARNEGEVPLQAPSSLESGQRIETPAEGGASLQFSTGSSMTLAGRTSFRVDSQGITQRFTLQRGELVAHVAKLVASQRFIVNTPDAEVEVRGTRFRLRVIERGDTCGDGTRTRLEVSEGVVEVRAARGELVNVKAGEVWPAGCSGNADVPQNVAPAESVGRAATPAPRRGAPSPARAVVGDSESEHASGLTIQNDLFAEGVARGRRGDTSGALRAYQELINRFPRSPLAENAMVERMRLLAKSPIGALEASRYLERYPHGFAVREAKQLVAEP